MDFSLCSPLSGEFSRVWLMQPIWHRCCNSFLMHHKFGGNKISRSWHVDYVMHPIALGNLYYMPSSYMWLGWLAFLLTKLFWQDALHSSLTTSFWPICLVSLHPTSLEVCVAIPHQTPFQRTYLPLLLIHYVIIFWVSLVLSHAWLGCLNFPN